MKTATRNSHKPTKIAVPASKPVTLADVQACIQASLAGIMQALPASQPTVEEAKPKKFDKAAKRPKDRAFYAPHTAVEKSESGHALIRVFRRPDDKGFAFGISKARAILAVLPAIEAFVEGASKKSAK